METAQSFLYWRGKRQVQTPCSESVDGLSPLLYPDL